MSELFPADANSLTMLMHALIACTLLSLSFAPLGVFLTLRRMSLVVDSMSHAVLPGISAAMLLFGTSFIAMNIGGFISAMLVSLLTIYITRYTQLREDVHYAAIYLTALGLGVLLFSLHSDVHDLEHILFGDVFGLDTDLLLYIGFVCVLSVGLLTLFWRALVMDSVDTQYLRVASRYPLLYPMVFNLLLVMNLLAGFQALGTLLAMGLMILPAASSYFWTRNIQHMALFACAFAIISTWVGCSIAFTYVMPAGPAVILISGLIYLGSALFGRVQSIRALYFPFHHLKA